MDPSLVDDKLRPKYLAEHSVWFHLTAIFYSAKLSQCSFLVVFKFRLCAFYLLVVPLFSPVLSFFSCPLNHYYYYANTEDVPVACWHLSNIYAACALTRWQHLSVWNDRHYVPGRCRHAACTLCTHKMIVILNA